VIRQWRTTDSQSVMINHVGRCRGCCQASLRLAIDTSPRVGRFASRRVCSWGGESPPFSPKLSPNLPRSIPTFHSSDCIISAYRPPSDSMDFTDVLSLWPPTLQYPRRPRVAMSKLYQRLALKSGTKIDSYSSPILALIFTGAG